jgi:hypothetical protein
MDTAGRYCDFAAQCMLMASEETSEGHRAVLLERAQLRTCATASSTAPARSKLPTFSAEMSRKWKPERPSLDS